MSLIHAEAAVYRTSDNRSGCPGEYPELNDLFAKTIEVTSTSVVMATGHSARRGKGRHDFYLKLNDTKKDSALTYTTSIQWEDAYVHWLGEVPAGTHKFSVQGKTPDVWGCDSQWGDLDIIVLPKLAGMLAYQVRDKRSGCPPTAQADTDLIAQSITVSQPSVVVVTGHMIRKFENQAALYLYLGSTMKDATLTYSKIEEWEDGVVHWAGDLNPGLHTFSLRSDKADAWGCYGVYGAWGDLDILVLPKTLGVSAYQFTDKRSGCPPIAPAYSDLIKQNFTVLQPSIVELSGHMIRNATGRADLYLFVDGQQKDWSLTYTSSIKWEGVQLHWVGQVGAGKHTVSLRSDKENVWGCDKKQYGAIDVLVVPVSLKPVVSTPALTTTTATAATVTSTSSKHSALLCKHLNQTIFKRCHILVSCSCISSTSA